MCKSFLWLVPFACFVVGYIIASLIFTPNAVTIPPVVGLPLAQGAKLLSDQQLSLRVVGEKEDSTLPPETIISQEPHATLRVRPHHAVLIVIAKTPAKQKTPSLLGQTLENADSQLKKEGISYKHSIIESNAPTGTIVAQDPAPGSELPETIHLYSAQNTNNWYVLPNVAQHQLTEVTEFFNRQHIPINTVYPEETISSTRQYHVVEQRPLPGSLIKLSNPPTVQLLVQEMQPGPLQIPLQINAQEVADSFLDAPETV